MNINLLEKVEKLLIAIPTTNSISPIVEHIYSELRRNTPNTLYSILENWNKISVQLKVYDYIPEVFDFIQDKEEFFLENNLSIKSIIALKKIQGSTHSSYYKDAAIALQNLIENKNESNISEAIYENLKDYTWISEIKELHKLSEIKEKGLTLEDFRYTSKSVYTPILPVRENDNTESYIFYSSGKIFKLTDTEISESKVSINNGTFRALCEAVDKFNIKGNSISANYPSTKIEIVKENEVKVFMNSKEIPLNELSDFFLNTTGFSGKSKQDIALISAVAERYEDIIELEFGKKIISTTNEGVSLTMFKLNKDVYLQKINKLSGINEFGKYEVNDAIKEAKRYLGVDITNWVSDLLEETKSLEISKIKEYQVLQEQNASLMIRRDKFITESIQNGILDELPIKEAIQSINNLIEVNNVKLSNIEGNIGRDNNVLMEGTINTNMGPQVVTFYAKEYLSADKFINININGHSTLCNKKDIDAKKA